MQHGAAALLPSTPGKKAILADIEKNEPGYATDASIPFDVQKLPDLHRRKQESKGLPP